MFKRIASAAMAAVMAISLLPQVSLPVKAESASLGLDFDQIEHKQWQGYEAEKGVSLDSLNFDIWDSDSGPTTGWYDAAAGTKDDPYIISSASDLAGIQALIDAQRSGGADVLYNCYYADSSEYGNATTTGAVEIWDYSRDITDPSAHYYHTDVLYSPDFMLKYRHSISDPVVITTRRIRYDDYGEQEYYDEKEEEAYWYTEFYIDIYYGDQLVGTVDLLSALIKAYGGLSAVTDPVDGVKYFKRYEDGGTYTLGDYKYIENPYQESGRSCRASGIYPDSDRVTFGYAGLTPFSLYSTPLYNESVSFDFELVIPEGTVATNYLGETIDISGDAYKYYKLRNLDYRGRNELWDRTTNITGEYSLGYGNFSCDMTSSNIDPDAEVADYEYTATLKGLFAGDTFDAATSNIINANDLYDVEFSFRFVIRSTQSTAKITVYGPDDSVYATCNYVISKPRPSNYHFEDGYPKLSVSYHDGKISLSAGPVTFKHNTSTWQTFSINMNVSSGDDITAIDFNDIATLVSFDPVVGEGIHDEYDPDTVKILGSMSEKNMETTRKRWNAYANNNIIAPGGSSHLFENSYFKMACNIDLGAESTLAIFNWGESDTTTFKGSFDLNGHYLIGGSERLFVADFGSGSYFGNGTIASRAAMFSGSMRYDSSTYGKVIYRGDISDLDIYSLAAFYKDTSLMTDYDRFYPAYGSGMRAISNEMFAESAENVSLHAYEFENFGLRANTGRSLNVVVLSSGKCPFDDPTTCVTAGMRVGGEWTDSVITYDVPIVTGYSSAFFNSSDRDRLVLHNSIVDLDWDCTSEFTDSSDYISLSTAWFIVTAYDSKINLDFKADMLGNFSDSRYYSSFYNCDVSIRLPARQYKSTGYAYGSFDFYDSNVQVTDIACDVGFVFSGGFCGDAVNSVLNFELTNTCLPYLFSHGVIKNSIINIKQLDDRVDRPYRSLKCNPMFFWQVVESSVINMDWAGSDNVAGSIFAQCYVKNSDISIDSDISVSIDGCSDDSINAGLFENTNIACRFGRPHKSRPDEGHYYYYKDYSEFRDCNICILWADDAVGVVGQNPLEINSAKNTAIVIKGPKTVEYENIVLPCAMDTGSFISWNNSSHNELRKDPSNMQYRALYDGILVVNGVTLSGENSAVIKAAYHYSYGSGYNNDYSYSKINSISNLHVFADIYTKDIDNLTVIDRVSGIIRTQMSGSVLNAIDYYTGKPYDGILSMMVLDKEYYNSGVPVINDMYFKSNAASANVALLSAPKASLGSDTQRLMYDVYMNLPNAPQITDRSDTADGYRSGLFAYWDDDASVPYNALRIPAIDSTLSAYVSIATQAAPLRYSNVYVPEGQSFIYEYYNPDTISVDTWNAIETIADSSIKLNNEIGETSIDFIPDGAYYVSDWETAELDGSLAYKLDHGSNHYRRTNYWTVVEDIDLTDPLTDEHIVTIPAHLGHTGELYPTNMVADVPNLNAVYKLTMNEADAGAIEAVGVDNISAKKGDVYVKYGSKPISRIVTDDDSKILVCALQSINEGIPVRISAQRLLALNSADGFSMPSADVEITPVFKTARNITVELTGEPEHGSIVPSEFVSAEGEEIYLFVNSDVDYIVSDIQVNGEPCTDFRFMMPDDDVIISAKVIPFEGGIKDFRLGGFAGVIDQNKHTIILNIPRISSIEHMKPYIEYAGKSISPSEDQYLDFTKPQTFTVTYGPDDSTVTYAVEVNMSDYDMRIHDYVINGVHGNINQANKTISVILPNGTDLTGIVPDAIVYSAEALSPAEDTAIDFTSSRVYTLTADRMTPVNYLVTVTTAADDAAILNELRIGGYDAVIDQSAKTAVITVPRLANLDGIVPNIVKYTGKTITGAKTDSLNLEDRDDTYTILSQNDIPVTYTVHANRMGDDEARIDRFVLAGYEGVIDQDAKTIKISVPYGTVLADVVPDAIEYAAAGIYPTKDTPNDFSTEQPYIAYALDGTEVEYMVSVDYDSDALITEFTLLGVDGVIDQEQKTITVTLPNNVKINNAVPDKIVWSDGATLSPSDDTARNFTGPVEYTVTSYSGKKSNAYTVNVILEETYDNLITRYVLNGVEGEITHIGDYDGRIDIEIYLDSKSKLTKDDFNNIVPDVIEWSKGATLNPSDKAAQDYVDNNPVYVVTSKMGEERTYVVYVTFIIPDTKARIIEYRIPDPEDPENPDKFYEGTIDEETGIITIDLPNTVEPEDIVNLVPDITWEGKTITPGEDAPQDYNYPIDYTVKAEDPYIERDYTVIVTIEGREVKYYKVLTESNEGGTVKASPRMATEGTGISVTVYAEPGYHLESLYVDGVKVSFSDGMYSFDMPAHDVIIRGVFEKDSEPDDPPGNPPKDPDKPTPPKDPDKPEDPDKPDEPGDPDKPDEPEDPDKPDIPDEPIIPDRPPVIPPDDPDEPDDPDTPDMPKPGNPPTGDATRNILSAIIAAAVVCFVSRKKKK